MSILSQDDSLLKTEEAAKFLGLSVDWLAKARGNGTGPHYVKIGRAVRYSKSALLDFIERCTRGRKQTG